MMESPCPSVGRFLSEWSPSSDKVGGTDASLCSEPLCQFYFPLPFSGGNLVFLPFFMVSLLVKPVYVPSNGWTPSFGR